MALLANSGLKIASVYNRIAELGLAIARNDTNGFTNSVKQRALKKQLVSTVKQFRNLMRFSEYDDAGTFIGNNGRITDEQFNKLLRYLIKTADVRTVPVSAKLLFRGVPTVINSGVPGEQGEDGVSSYVYIGYADDNIGTNFSTSPGTRPYIAFKNSNIPLTVVAGIFAGLWTKYFGTDGAPGNDGAPGTTYYLHLGWADDSSGTGYTATFDASKKYIAFLINTTPGDPGAGAFTGLWAKYLGDNGTNGTDGRTIYSGSGVPSSGLGANGDFYIDLASDPRLMYGPKTAGAWGSGYSLKGNQGDQGDPGDDGADGEDAFLYVAYADDTAGTGFTMAFDPNKNYIAVKNTNVAIVSPVVSDFAGLWTKYRGDGDKWTTDSSTSMTIGTGVQAFFVATDLAYSTGQRVVISVPFDETNRMEGICQGYDPLTGQLTVDVDTVYGAGTYSSWSVSLQGAPISVASVDGYYGAIGTDQGSGGVGQATSTSPAKLTQFDAQISQSAGMSADHSADRITVDNRGAYVVGFDATISGTASAEFTLQLYKNGVAVVNVQSHVKLDGSGTKQNVSVGPVTLQDVNQGDYFEIYVTAGTGTPTILMEQGRLDMHTVGAPNTEQFKLFGPTNVGVATVTIDQFSASAGNFVIWDVLVKKGNNIRGITCSAIWDGTNPPNFEQGAPNDLAGPIDITLSATFSGGNINLVATGTSATWVLTGIRKIVA